MIVASLAAACLAPVAAARPSAKASLGTASAAIAHTSLSGSRAGALLADGSRYWGGRVSPSSNHTLTIYLSDAYPEDPAVLTRWASFFRGLVHGPELDTLTAYLAPPEEVQSLCGGEAAACYSSDRSLLVAPAEEVAADFPAESIVMHEYGHHVAASRENDPWRAVEWGTKRWASHERVCPRARAGEIFPGAEEDYRYTLNPGEAFAEAYRVLNERRLGRPESPWAVVDESLYPDERALALVEQDVLQPWRGNTSSTLAGSLRRRGAARTYSVATPLDGSLVVTVRGPRSGAIRVDLLTAAGARVGRATSSRSSRATVRTTVCGTRAFRLRVTQLSGRGAYRLAVSKP